MDRRLPRSQRHPRVLAWSPNIVKQVIPDNHIFNILARVPNPDPIGKIVKRVPLNNGSIPRIINRVRAGWIARSSNPDVVNFVPLD